MKKLDNIKTYAKLHHKQAGMTLIELTVVLLILIGLAGLMIPYVSGFIERTHDSTGTNNLARLNNTIQRFQVQYNSFPDDMHSLIDVNGTPAVYGALMNTSFLAPSGDLTMIRNMSLTNAGISSVFSMIDTTDTANAGASRTFAAGSASVLLATTGMNVAVLGAGDRTSIENHLALSFGRQITDFNATCYDYVVMGVGQESEMTGRTMTDAPIHFAQNGDMGPENNYNRFVAVFEVDKLNTTAAAAATGSVATDLVCSTNTEQAKFIGTAMIMMPQHLIGLAEEMESAYASMAAK